MDTKRQIAVTCLNCRRRFSFSVDPERGRLAALTDQDGRPLGNKRILPRSFAVPCPFCRVQNVVPIL